MNDRLKAGLSHCASNKDCKECPYFDLFSQLCFKRIATHALAYIQQLEEKSQRWISVEEKLPETDNYCIVFEPGYGYEVCMYYGDGEWLTRDLSNVTRLVSHWMPLPEMPEEDS